MPVTYTLEDSIATFLTSQTGATREECDQLARSLLSGEISPVPIQGAFSYTVADQSRLVQCRSRDSPLDPEVLRHARSIHGSLVAETTYHGQIGQDRPLLVYVIEKLPGVTYMEYRLESDFEQRLDEQHYKRQQTLVEDFARYVYFVNFDAEMLNNVKVFSSVVEYATGSNHSHDAPDLRG
jgi:hypothetical protein